MPAPLCAYVLVTENRFCRHHGIYVVEGKGGKRYCRGHARKAGVVVGRIGTPRRWLYGRNPNVTVKTPVIVEWPELDMPGQSTRSRNVALYATATTGEGFDPEMLAPEDELIDGFVKRVESYAGTKYGTNEPQEKVKITLEGTGEYAGKQADKIYSISLHEKANLRPVFVAVMGFEPEDEKQYDLELLQGKPCRFMAAHVKTDRGGIFARIETVKPPRAAKAKKPVVVVEDDDEDDADLDDA